MVVASTASTVPESRTDFAKSRLVTVELDSRLWGSVADDCARSANVRAATAARPPIAVAGQRSRRGMEDIRTRDIRRSQSRNSWSFLHADCTSNAFEIRLRTERNGACQSPGIVMCCLRPGARRPDAYRAGSIHRTDG